MVEIRYGEQYEVTDLAGLTVSEAREQFRAEFGIPDKARAKLNGSKVKASAEPDTVLNDDDKVTFAVARNRAPFLVGALLLALAVTSGVFAFGYTTASTEINAQVYESDFAKVTVNSTDAPSWKAYGFFKGSTGNGTLFDVDTNASTYTGDLVVTVSIANGDELVKAYRVLAMKLMMVNSADNVTIDINEDTSANADDYVLLTLGNGSVDMFPDGTAGCMTVMIKSGFYISHIWGSTGWAGYEDPLLFCEVAQRGT